MLTFFLIFVVLLINLFVYGLDSPHNYGVASHLYYGVMILAGIYDNRRGQYLLLAFTTLANWVHAGLYYEQIHLGVVAILYPIIAYFIVRTIQLFKAQRSTTEAQLQQIDQDQHGSGKTGALICLPFLKLVIQQIPLLN